MWGQRIAQNQTVRNTNLSSLLCCRVVKINCHYVQNRIFGKGCRANTYKFAWIDNLQHYLCNLSMNVLVTGAGGFLGRYIVERLLAKGYRIKALGRKCYPDLQAAGVEFIQADLCNRDSVINACRSVNVVFHVAGIAGLGGRWREFYQINTLGTRWIIEGCLRHGVGRLIHTSSPSVIFDGTDQCGVDESVPYPCRWLCNYAQTKALAEQEVLAANGKNKLLTCVLRPHLLWGPGDKSLTPRLLDRARRGRLIQVGDGTNRIDTTYVENAADAHIQAADSLRLVRPRPETCISFHKTNLLIVGIGSTGCSAWPGCRR